MATTRDFKAPPILAQNAETTIPQTPVAGVAYRKDPTAESVIEDGYRYNTIADSMTIANQFQFLLSQITKTIEQQGILGWCDLVDYQVNAFAVGSDGLLYKSIAVSGPNQGGAADPINSPTIWNVITPVRTSTDVTSVRTLGVNYTNNFPYDIEVHATSTIVGSGLFQALIENNVVVKQGSQLTGVTLTNSLSITVPPGAEYRFEGGTLDLWTELS